MKRKRKNTRVNGSAILTVLGIVAVVSIVCGMLGLAATQQMHASQITRDMLRARTIAESGLNKAYHAVKENFALAKDYSLSESFDGGTYNVRAASLTGLSANRAQLIAEGVCGLGKSTVSVDLENRPLRTTEDDGDDNFYDLKYDLLVGGDLLLNGNIRALFNAIFANGKITIGGSTFFSATTLASAKTVTVKNPSKVAGPYTKEEGQPPQAISPEALQAAIDAFKEYAEKNGAVYESAASIPASPPGGVAYCTDPNANWNGQGTGCFIFEGAVNFQGSGLNVNSVDGYPALIVLSASSVKINSDAEIYGAVLMPNASLTVNGHAEIHGAMLVGQGMGGNGTADLYPGDSQGFNLPPEESQTDNVVITAWH